MHVETRMRTLSLAGIVALSLAASPGLAQAREIPVYPGAKLVLEKEPGEEPACCDFLARDPLEKVLAFYEGALKSKPLDAGSLAARYPDLKPQLDQMAAQMPPSMKIRFFVLAEVAFQGKKGADLFEVVSSPAGVRFTIAQGQLAGKDSRFAAEWSEKAGPDAGTARPRAVDASVLAEALPASAPAGFEKEDATAQNGGDQSSASVQFRKLIRRGTGGEGGSNDVAHVLAVNITDMPGEAETLREMIKAQQKGERAIRVKGKYDGKESIEKNEYGCVQSSKSFVVGSRYLVEASSNLCDLAVVDRVIDGMSLDRLPVK